MKIKHLLPALSLVLATNAYAWVSNQGGGQKPCDTKFIPELVETQISGDNACNTVDNVNWNYHIDGYIRIANTSNKKRIVYVNVYVGNNGDWHTKGSVYQMPTETYTIDPKTTVTVPFRTRYWKVSPYSGCMGFWVTLYSAKKSVACMEVNYDTTEHDNAD